MSQSQAPAASAASGLGLRAFHALVFLGFGSATVAGMLTELRQLGEGLFYPWHCGTPPAPLGTAAALVAILLMLALVLFLGVGRSAPLWLSGVMLVCLLVSMFSQDYPFTRRSAPGANLQMFEVGKLLHEQMRTTLQRTLLVPKLKADWDAALAAAVGHGPALDSPYRARYFAPAPWRIVMLAREGEFQVDAPPGSFQIFVPPDASRFSISMLGLDPTHQVVRLRDDLGEVFELKGVFTPDTLQ